VRFYDFLEQTQYLLNLQFRHNYECRIFLSTV
jgi:hypothetical protein